MKKRLLMIASYAESLVTFRLDLMRDAIDKGYEVHAAAPEISAEISHKLASHGIHVHNIRMRRTGLNPIADLATLLALVALIKKVKPTHTLAYTIKPVVYGCLAAMICRVPHINALITGLGYTFMETQRLPQKAISLIAKSLYWIALRPCENVFFQNPDDKHLFESMGLVSTAKSTLVKGSGINIEQFTPHHFPELTHIHFLMIARLIKDKGVIEYAHAAEKVRQDFPNATFHLVGWFDDNPTAISNEQVVKWEQNGTLIFHGKLDDVRPIIQRCHVYVLPSYREGTPRTVLEAMAMGRPIITSDAPGCRETVETDYNGLLVQVKNSDALAHAMKTFCEHPDKIAQFGGASRERAERLYDVRKVNASMLYAMEGEG
ncbi:glycosyltransferase family 4 protein [Aestuariibacter sp. AA17]|uniref:Glycosyltransferase family 4 protein n=1 Tax=Fluctibacter corallii TaxID=2984329 RepID=A0ABT3ADE2_9ALTE|nr:glycosyltransferase family 4 protein [Aestuariibacter sp. AA17]MCV2886686.1 glycosyltransferase family 4 protein [Aestuariibacter sp. AA17]